MIGRLARTVAHLHPLQIAARPPMAVLARVVRNVPSGLAPGVLDAWPSAPDALRRLAGAERARGADRLARLPAGSRLRAYEEAYGLELGADDLAPAGDWSSSVAVEPYPASVRARRIAVATRCGRRGLERELARAARAVLLRPEVHLLGNHLLENGFALACAGAVARGREGDVWWDAGEALLAWQLPAQFLRDGGHVERSASYHVALTAALLETIELARASRRVVPSSWLDVASRALGWARAVRSPDGSYPLLNDAALDASPGLDDVLALGAALDLETADVARVRAASGASLAVLDPTGWVRLDAGDASLVVDAGPDADGWQPGHAHADGLTFELWVHGRRAIVDFGVASYEPGAAREETRATRSHNTLEVDGRDSCEVWASFRVGRRGRGRMTASDVSDGVALVALEHDGYAWLPGAPRHARTLALGARRLEVRDRIAGGPHGWASRLRVDVEARVRVTGEGQVQRREDRWHPRHGDPRPALVFEQRGRRDDPGSVVWSVEW
jgi:uncharacterized heparinase superfamily protein